MDDLRKERNSTDYDRNKKVGKDLTEKAILKEVFKTLKIKCSVKTENNIKKRRILKIKKPK